MPAVVSRWGDRKIDDRKSREWRKTISAEPMLLIFLPVIFLSFCVRPCLVS